MYYFHPRMVPIKETRHHFDWVKGTDRHTWPTEWCKISGEHPDLQEMV